MERSDTFLPVRGLGTQRKTSGKSDANVALHCDHAIGILRPKPPREGATSKECLAAGCSPSRDKPSAHSLHQDAAVAALSSEEVVGQRRDTAQKRCFPLNALRSQLAVIRWNPELRHACKKG